MQKTLPQVEKKQVKEDNVTISSSMLTQIPEVDLGFIAKLKNIEETEKAKSSITRNQNDNSLKVKFRIIRRLEGIEF